MPEPRIRLVATFPVTGGADVNIIEIGGAWSETSTYNVSDSIVPDLRPARSFATFADAITAALIINGWGDGRGGYGEWPVPACNVKEG